MKFRIGQKVKEAKGISYAYNPGLTGIVQRAYDMGENQYYEVLFPLGRQNYALTYTEKELTATKKKIG